MERLRLFFFKSYDSQGLMIDAANLKAHRTASSLAVKKGGLGRLTYRTKSGMNTERHAVADLDGRRLSFFMTTGPVSDDTGAAAVLGGLPKAQWLLGVRGYSTDR